MGNCLLTKLKGVANNDNLPLFNVLKLEHVTKATGTDYDGITIKSLTPCRIYVDGDGVMATATTEVETSTLKELNVEADASPTVYFSNPTDSYNIFVTEKYSIQKFENRASGNSTKGCIAGNLSEFKYTDNLKILRLAFTNITGSLSDLPKGNLTELTLMGSTNIKGIAKEVASNSGLTLCNIFSNGSDSISGTVEDFVATQISAGRTTCDPGDLRARAMLKVLTFGGEIQYDEDKNCFPSWSSANKIAVYVTSGTGKTYNYNSVTTIYAKGATAEEITAWENDGKTVVEVY